MHLDYLAMLLFFHTSTISQVIDILEFLTKFHYDVVCFRKIKNVSVNKTLRTNLKTSMWKNIKLNYLHFWAKTKIVWEFSSGLGWYMLNSLNPAGTPTSHFYMYSAHFRVEILVNPSYRDSFFFSQKCDFDRLHKHNVSTSSDNLGIKPSKTSRLFCKYKKAKLTLKSAISSLWASN